tara:strand:+ start:2885 stop:3658 length:774 start_codon:yes stop_codon:yes gene_type:complete
MIKILILEDELPARKKLKRFLEQLQLDVKVIAEIESVETGIEFLQASPALDLIISDIELRDGNAFEIFEKVSFPCPIIFTTAYNEFWLEAFESNGIAYLLKPISLDKFRQAWDKFQLLTQQPSPQLEWFQQLQSTLKNASGAKDNFKSRFSIPTSRGNYYLDTKEVVYFSAESGLVYALDVSGKRHLMKEATLKEIEITVDPSHFFRINRSELVQKSFVQGTQRYSKNSVAIKISGIDQHLICSQSQTPTFLNWIEQ